MKHVDSAPPWFRLARLVDFVRGVRWWDSSGAAGGSMLTVLAAAPRERRASFWHRRIFAAAIAALACGGTAAAADHVVLQLHGPEQFEFAGYYAALWQGFYSSAGLEVEIRPGGGKPPVDPAREAIDGHAQF